MRWRPLGNALIALAAATVLVAAALAVRPGEAAVAGPNGVQVTYVPGAGGITREMTLRCPGTTAPQRRACRTLARAHARGLLGDRAETGPGTLRLRGALDGNDVDVTLRGPDEYRFRALAPALLAALPMR